MDIKKSWLMVLGGGLVIVAGFLLLQFSGQVLQKSVDDVAAKETEVDGIKEKAPAEKPQPVEAAPKNQNVDGKKVFGDKAEKIDIIQKELSEYADQQILDEIATLKAQIRKEDLVDRMNRNVVTEEEKTHANELLLRLALLGVEKNKRRLDKTEPQ